MCRLVSKLLLADIHVVTISEICNYYDSIINMLTRSAARHFLLYWQTSLQQQNFTKQVLTNKFSLSPMALQSKADPGLFNLNASNSSYPQLAASIF
jgi:hypothetical protein